MDLNIKDSWVERKGYNLTEHFIVEDPFPHSCVETTRCFRSALGNDIRGVNMLDGWWHVTRMRNTRYSASPRKYVDKLLHYFLKRDDEGNSTAEALFILLIMAVPVLLVGYIETH